MTPPPPDRLDLGELALRAQAATPGPWLSCYNDSGTHADTVAHVAESLARGSGDRVYGVHAPHLREDGKGVVWPAITGNGPTSEANAYFIAACDPQSILALLARLARAEGALRKIANGACWQGDNCVCCSEDAMHARTALSEGGPRG